MGEQAVSSAVTVFLAIVGLAIVATLVSKNANTSGVVNSVASGFSGALTAAEGPVSGSSFGGLNVAGTYNGAGLQ